MALALGACQMPGASRIAEVPARATLRVGTTATLPDRSTLTYVRLLADSRCRPEVVCIRAGDADIELRWAPVSGAPVSTVINSDPRNAQGTPNSADVGPWRIRLASLDWQQPPRATLEITADPAR